MLPDSGVTDVQMIVNCLAFVGNRFVLLQKPRRGWWVLPGGKVEATEVWPEAAARELTEETGLTASGLELVGLHRLWREAREDAPRDQVIVQFHAAQTEGQLLTQSKEGRLATFGLDEWQDLPMNPADKIMVEHAVLRVVRRQTGIYIGKFRFAAEDKLLDWQVSLH